ncbi:MAG: hypothetical protein JWM80_5621 [Cyanobacteria bacterium RYN_339]|nr:hypothetical protein [Cyanobacteria bacterium RYN_339]
MGADGTADPGPGRPSDAAGLLGREALDNVHAYVVAMDRVLARAHEASPELALRQLEAIVPPAELPSGHLLERKRRELLERFNLARHQHLRLPDVGLDAWLAFMLAAAEMGGSAGIAVDWAPTQDGPVRRELVPVEHGSSFRRAQAVNGRTLADVRELSHVAPGGPSHAALDAATGWLTLAAPPWIFRQVLRELDRVTGAAPLDVALAYDPGREIQEGTGLAVRLAVRNVSDDVIVLEDVCTDHPYDPAESFTHVAMGRLAHDPSTDRYAYDAVAPGVTATAFRTAVLRPGEERVVVLTLKLLEGGECWRSFRLRYHRFDPAAFRHMAYVAMPGPSHVFPPQVSYGPIAALERPDAADTTTVILAGNPLPGHALRWAYPFHVGRRAFSLAQARNRVPDGCEPVHYSRWQQAWVMRLAEGCALVSPSRVTLYPRVDPRAFILIDEAEQRVPVRFSEALLPVFRSLPLGVTDWESHGLGLSVSLPKLKLTSFFQEAERLGVALGLGENLLGRRTLLVLP